MSSLWVVALQVMGSGLATMSGIGCRYSIESLPSSAYISAEACRETACHDSSML
jgi:hypothetical protein